MWHLHAASFSDYVYSCVWDHRLVFQQPALVAAQNIPLSAWALSALSIAFQEEIQTHGGPGSTQYRFIRDGQAILIWSAEGQADW